MFKIKSLLLLSMYIFTSITYTYDDELPIVILDAGHGGNDLGTSNKQKKLIEKDLNLTVMLMVNRLLLKHGIETYMTRIDDQFISLKDRVETTKKLPNALFVSIHFNYCSKSSVHGTEIYYCNNVKKEKSIQLGKEVLKNICNCSYSKNRGIRKSNFYVLKYNKHPSILIECEYVSSQLKSDNLKTITQLKKISQGISQGVIDYIFNTYT